MNARLVPDLVIVPQGRAETRPTCIAHEVKSSDLTSGQKLAMVDSSRISKMSLEDPKPQ
jgi:hypothetical protein